MPKRKVIKSKKKTSRRQTKRRPATKPTRRSTTATSPRRQTPRPSRSKPPAPVAVEKYTQEYREYLERYALMGKGRPKLNPLDFDKMDNELIDLLTIQAEIGALSDEQIVRLQELEFLLLEGE